MEEQLELFDDTKYLSNEKKLFDDKQRLIKEEETKYYEVIDSKGERTIRKVTNIKRHFPRVSGSKHNPACSNHVEIL